MTEVPETITETEKNEIKKETFYRVDDMAKFLCVSVSTVYHYVENQTIQYHRIGGIIKFTQEDFDSISRDTIVKAKRRKRKFINNKNQE
jgi:excisionase family DNA binding protein